MAMLPALLLNSVRGARLFRLVGTESEVIENAPLLLRGMRLCWVDELVRS